jgi:hypothetical protein
MAVALASLLATSAFAAGKDWKVDSRNSYGEIATEAKSNQSRQTVTLGAARISGILRLDANKPANSIFEFEAKPDTNPRNAAIYSALYFRSRKAELTKDGRLRVTGPLTVREVRLDALLEGNEAYYGPEFTGQVVKEITREESFLLALPADDPVDAQGQATMDMIAEGRIMAEDFPELVSAVLSTNWPDMSVGSDGPVAGPAVRGPWINRTAISFGEDYPGEGSEVAEAGDALSIALHLLLT